MFFGYLLFMAKDTAVPYTVIHPQAQLVLRYGNNP